MNAVDFLYESYNVDRNAASPIKLEITRWGSLPRIFRRLGYKVGAEIGVSSGLFSKCLCDRNPDLRLYSIDAWQIYPGYTYADSQQKMDKLYSKARERLMPYKCNIVRGWSMDVVKRFANESLDFVYIDANHDYEHVIEDIREWSKKVRKGGIVSGHDYINELHGMVYGVKQAVDQWVAENKIHPLWVLNKNAQTRESPSWMYVKEKNEAPTGLRSRSFAKGNKVTKGIIYYTDNRLDEKIMKRCQQQLKKVESSTLPIVSVSLKPIEFGQNYTLEEERGYLTLTKQIIKALEESTADIVFFCEHDVLYHPSHFDFTPARKDVFYYNMNSWMLRANDGHCLYYDHRSLSGMCCFRETALAHFRKRKERIEALMAEAGNTGSVKATSGNTISLKEGIHRLGFEPGTHDRPERIDTLKAESWKSEFPNVDIRHSGNLTQNRFRKDQFRNARSYEGWTESNKIPFWGKGTEIIWHGNYTHQEK